MRIYFIFLFLFSIAVPNMTKIMCEIKGKKTLEKWDKVNKNLRGNLFLRRKWNCRRGHRWRRRRIYLQSCLRTHLYSAASRRGINVAPTLRIYSSQSFFMRLSSCARCRMSDTIGRQTFCRRTFCWQIFCW